MADYSDADVQSLAQKLTQFKETLTQGEQAAMAAVIQRGMPQGEDVEGFFDRRPNEGAIGVQEGADPFSPLTSIFYPQTRPDRDRPGQRH